jgi:aminomethyltransferase
LIRTTPFHPRLSELNSQGLYTHWQGTLSPLRYTAAPKHEYFAVRNSVGVFDTSPLFEYRVSGPDAERLLAGVLTRDIRSCRPGRALYSVWCDDRGHVMEDGVVFRHSESDFLLTAARPNLGWLEEHRGRLRVELEDVTDDYGILAVQGPRSRTVLAALAPEVASLRYFAHTPAKIGSAAVTVSRTGYSGDLGYEVTVPADDALAVLDAVLEAGQGQGMRPFGEEALMTLRIEAGLALIDIDWTNARTAWTDAQRVSPSELGMGWMLRGIDDDTRPFVGREAIRRELAEGTSRWVTTGIVVDWQEWDDLHRGLGLLPTKDPTPLPYESLLYGENGEDGGDPTGYVTSFCYSPVLQRHIGIARLRADVAQGPGTPVRMELAIEHRNTTVGAVTTSMPFFNPERKVSTP